MLVGFGILVLFASAVIREFVVICRVTASKASLLMCRKPKQMHWFEYFLIES